MIRSSSAKALPIIAFTLAFHLLAAIGFAGTVPVKHKHRRKNTAHQTAAAKRRVNPVRKTPVKPAVSVESQTPVRVTPVHTARFAVAGPRPVAVAAPIIAGGPWTSPTYADSTDGDNIDGEDMDIRRAAVDALGQYNGSVVVVDPSNGLVLSMVN